MGQEKNGNNSGMKERRKFERVAVKNGLQTFIGNSEPPFLLDTEIIDVSRKGILAGCDFSLTNLLMVKNHKLIVFNFGSERVRNVEGRIAWISPEKKNGRFLFGINLVDQMEGSLWSDLSARGDRA